MQLSKRTKEKHFHGPIFGTVPADQNETAKSQNQQQRPFFPCCGREAVEKEINSKGRPVQQTKNDNCVLVTQQAYRVGTEENRTCEA